MKFLNFSHHDHYSHRMAHTAIGPKRSEQIRHREAFLDTRPYRRLRPSDRYSHRMRYARGYGAAANEKGHETSTDSYEKYACNPGDVSWRRLYERPGRASTRGCACACPAPGGRPGSIGSATLSLWSDHQSIYLCITISCGEPIRIEELPASPV
jgi:hypothetical protein